MMIYHRHDSSLNTLDLKMYVQVKATRLRAGTQERSTGHVYVLWLTVGKRYHSQFGEEM